MENLVTGYSCGHRFPHCSSEPTTPTRVSRLLTRHRSVSPMHKKRPEQSGLFCHVRGRGLEPPCPCGRYHLKVVRLPVSPPAHSLRNRSFLVGLSYPKN